MANVKTAKDFDPPKNTGNEYVDRAFIDLRNILIDLSARVENFDQTPKNVVYGPVNVGSEPLIEYRGSGGETVKLPAANFIPGTRSQLLYIFNTGPGTLTIAANGTDTVNGAASITLGTGSYAILRSNGLTKWLSK